MTDGGHHTVWRRIAREARLRSGCVYAIYCAFREAPLWPDANSAVIIADALDYKQTTVSRILSLFERERIIVDGVLSPTWADGRIDRHENSVTKITKTRHENSAERHENDLPTRGPGRPKAPKPLTSAERSKRYRNRARGRIFVTVPDNENLLHELKKTNSAQQVEAAAREAASPAQIGDTDLTPPQLRKVKWVEANLSYAWFEKSGVTAEQAGELMNALPDDLVIRWAKGQEKLPGWAKHHLGNLDQRRKASQPVPQRELRLLSAALPNRGRHDQNQDPSRHPRSNRVFRPR